MRAILCLQPSGHVTPAPQRAPSMLAACSALTPRVEPAPSGILYCDLSSSDTWSAAHAAVQALLRDLEATARVPEGMRAGLAPGRFPAFCAAVLAAPGTLQILTPDTVQAALAPLPVSLLPGLAPAHLRTLHELRIFTLGELAAVPAPILRAVCGAGMPALAALARGEDPSPVARALPASGTSRAVRCPVPTHAGADALFALLDTLAADLAAALAERGQAAREVELTVGFDGERPLSRKLRLTPPAVHTAELRTAASPLLGRLLRARRLRPAWLGLEAVSCCEAAYQPHLPVPPARADQLQGAVAAIRQRFGPHVIQVGVSRP